MSFSRRRFLVTGTAALSAGVLSPSWAANARKQPAPTAATAADLRDWSVVRQQFDLAPDYTHLGLFYLTSHPRPVRAAIDSYRQRLDRNPFITVERSLFEKPEDNL